MTQPTKADLGKPDLGKPDFKRRFMAWWDGVDLDAKATGGGPVQAGPATGSGPARLEVQDLTDRLAVMQDLWGPGFAAPGGPEFAADLCAMLNLSNEKSLLDVGAGLGGPARAITQKYGVWITGFESIADMASAAEQLSAKMGLAKKVKIQAFDPENGALPVNKFDAVWSKDILYSVKAKERLMQVMAKALKPRGQMLVIDYVVAEGAETAPEIEAWRKVEAKDPSPWTLAEYERGFAQAGLDLRVTDELSDRYIQFITDAWSRWRAVVADVDATGAKEPARLPALRRALAAEADLWAQRFEMLKGGKLKVLRFYALKPAPEVKR